MEENQMIYTAARIVTMAGDPVRAIVVEGGRVVNSGSLEALRERYPAAEVVDMGDGVIVPGFHDAHMHLASTADQLLQLDLSSAQVHSVAEVTERVRQEAIGSPTDHWIMGSRYDDGKMAEGRTVTRFDLDEVAPDHPVLIRQVAGHWAVVNSRALALGGIDEESNAPEGGLYGRDASGRLNGILYERALVEFSRGSNGHPGVVPGNTLEDRLRGLRRATEMMHASGLTSVCDASTGLEDLELFAEGQRRGDLTLRVSTLIRYDSYDQSRRVGAWPAGEFLRTTGVKAVLDGAIGGRTCLLEEPFEGSSDNHGIQAMSTRDLRDMVQLMARDGTRPCVHANGDRAISLLLDQLEQIEPEVWQQRRPRVEHCSIVTEDILGRLRKVGAVTTPFASYVHYHGSNLSKWYGDQRLLRMFAHRSFLDWGIPVAAASDYGCGPFEPLLGMQSCITRRGWDGPVLGENQRITPLEALALYTTGAAYATSEEQIKGKLAPGFYADFVVLGADPLATDPAHLADVPVLATYVNGESVWSSGGSRN